MSLSLNLCLFYFFEEKTKIIFLGVVGGCLDFWYPKLLKREHMDLSEYVAFLVTTHYITTLSVLIPDSNMMYNLSNFSKSQRICN